MKSQYPWKSTIIPKRRTKNKNNSNNNLQQKKILQKNNFQQKEKINAKRKIKPHLLDATENRVQRIQSNH